jgi:Type I restriction enzyme R protein N terminus (HSDR_N)
MFTDFNPALLDDPDFKEDSVREVIIIPLLSRLGYSPSGPNRVVRSKSLSHPFIYAGTRKCPVTLIPDYTLLSDQKVLLVIDAKRPTEDILNRSNVQQAYSYAIHPEIKSDYFALCNGKSLVIFSVDNNIPILFVPFSEFESKWDEIERHLAPKYLKHPMLRSFAPDFGCALSRLGLAEGATITLLPLQLGLFAKLDDTMLTASSNIEFSGKPHCASFDFDSKLLPEVLAGLPIPLAEEFTNALSRAPFQAAADLAIELDAHTKLGHEIQVEFENYRPLIIESVIAARFNPQPLANEATDIPDGVFRLRRAYMIRSPSQKP